VEPELKQFWMIAAGAGNWGSGNTVLVCGISEQGEHGLPDVYIIFLVCMGIRKGV